MIAAGALVWGIGLAHLVGGRLERLSRVGVAHSGWVVPLFVLQGVARGRFSSTHASVAAVTVWAVCCVILVALLMRSRAEPGISLLAFGVALNLLVVLANNGMPYTAAGEAASAITPFYHPSGPATAFAMLGDVLPLPGGHVLLSLGDVLLLVGVVNFIVANSGVEACRRQGQRTVERWRRWS